MWVVRRAENVVVVVICDIGVYEVDISIQWGPAEVQMLRRNGL
jgi:hypothetical protein